MTGSQRKNLIYSAVLILAMLAVWWIRDSGPGLSNLKKTELAGTTMGTTYQVKYLTAEPVNLQSSIDSLLEDFNQCLSTYIPDSEISRFNRDTLHRFERPYFYRMLLQSQTISETTGGAFDPTVMPLVAAWGFGPDAPDPPGEAQMDSLLSAVGLENISFDQHYVSKLNPRTQLDFSAIAKGYAVDLVLQFLKDKNLTDIFVEIGGEIAACGVNETGKPWAIYIEKPLDHERAVQAVVSLDNIAVATSGNYRNFYMKDGKKYAHTISPFNGYPVQHSLLSVSVFAQSCAVADAYATAFMVLGLERAMELTLSNDELEAYFIYSGSKGELLTKATPGIENVINENEQ
jgi:thiamine biosynthesis lipoprotein